MLLYRDRWEFFLTLALQHLEIAGTACVLAGAVGLACGIWISERRAAVPFVLGATNILYTIPSISLLGILIPFSGIGDMTAIIALTVYGLLPMIHNTYAAFPALSPQFWKRRGAWAAPVCKCFAWSSCLWPCRSF